MITVKDKGKALVLLETGLLRLRILEIIDCQHRKYICRKYILYLLACENVVVEMVENRP